MDRQTDRIGVAYTCYSIYAVTRKNGHKQLLLDMKLQAFHLV